jgi:hypothetical protein
MIILCYHIHFPPKFLDLKLAYQWRKEDRHLVGYDATTGVKFGEYTFGDNMKEEATVRCLLFAWHYSY